MNRVTSGLRAPKWEPNDVVKKKYVEAFIYDDYAYGGFYSPESEAVSRTFVFSGLEHAYELARQFEKEKQQREMDEVMAAFGLKAEGISVEEFKRDVLDEPIYDEWDGRLDRIDRLSQPSWWTRLARYFGF